MLLPYRGVNHLDFSADGRYFLASFEFSGTIAKVDVDAMQVVGWPDVGGLAIDVRLSPDGSTFFVANQGRHGVSVVDGVLRRELSFIPTGRGAHGLYISRDTRSVYVANRLAGTISVIDHSPDIIRDLLTRHASDPATAHLKSLDQHALFRGHFQLTSACSALSTLRELLSAVQ